MVGYSKRLTVEQVIAGVFDSNDDYTSSEIDSDFSEEDQDPCYRDSTVFIEDEIPNIISNVETLQQEEEPINEVTNHDDNYSQNNILEESKV